MIGKFWKGPSKVKRPALQALSGYPINSRFAESYRTMRTNVQLSFMDGDVRSLLVTSAGEKEGKSTTSANLAYSMARTGKTTLLIDADLRKPSLLQIVKSKNSPGLTGLLSDTFGTDIGAGSLKTFGFSDLLWILSFQKKSGKLILVDGTEKVELFFIDGEPVDVQWVTRPDEKKLAALLASAGAITQEQAGRALLRATDTGQRIGAVMVNMGLVSEEQMAGYIELHLLEGLKIAIGLRSGGFEFVKVPSSRCEKPPFGPTDIRRLYTRLVAGNEDLPYVESSMRASVMATDQEGLFLLPSGPRPPNPGELLQSARMSFLLTYLNRHYDTLIIDTPPILPASDAVLLAPQAHGVVLVVKAGVVNRKLVQRALSQLRNAKANVIGVVLNQVNVNREGYYKYYRKYYSGY